MRITITIKASDTAKALRAAADVVEITSSKECTIDVHIDNEEPHQPRLELPETPILEMPIEKLNLRTWVRVRLIREGIHTVGGLILKTPDELADIRDIGPKSIVEVIRKLNEYGLTLMPS